MTITRINVRLPSAPIVDIMMLNSTFIVVQDCASFRTRNCNGRRIKIKICQNYSSNRCRLTKRRPRKTLRPSTSSKMISSRLAVTMIRSNMFQPHRKNSLERANSLTMHSNVKMDVKTCAKIVVNIVFTAQLSCQSMPPCCPHPGHCESSRSCHDAPWPERRCSRQCTA